MALIPVVRASDNRKGIIASIAFLLIALFLLFFIKYSEPDPVKVTVPIPIVMSEAGIEEFEIHNAGGGAPSESVTPTPATEEPPKEEATQEDSPVKVVAGSGTSKNNNTQPAEDKAEPNPFGGGSGGSGNEGSGGGFGSDSGPRSGSGEAGKGSAGERVRLSNIRSKPKTSNDERSTIALKLTVDFQGKVVRADVIRSGTTASNQVLIDEVIALVKKEVRYKEKPGARDEITYYTVTVQPG